MRNRTRGTMTQRSIPSSATLREQLSLIFAKHITSDWILAVRAWLVSQTTGALRTTEYTTPTVRLETSPHQLDQLLIELGDGAYWVPHDDEALRLDQYASVYLGIAGSC